MNKSHIQRSVSDPITDCILFFAIFIIKTEPQKTAFTEML